MTRDQILARLKVLQEQLDAQQLDPRHSHSEALAISRPILRELIELQDRLRALDGKSPG
jgi:hypothetical protein